MHQSPPTDAERTENDTDGAVPVVVSTANDQHATLEFARGRVAPSPESPERAEIIARALRAAEHPIIEVPSSDRPSATVDMASIGRVHTAEYVHFLETAWDRWIDHLGADAVDTGAVAFTWPRRNESASRPEDIVGRLGYHSFAGDSPIVAGTWDAVISAASVAQSAADMLLTAPGRHAVYALCRPPGHHATADQLGGYCYLNNAAIAAQRLLDAGCTRVGVLDVDYHHGNGTQSIFERRSDVLTVSIHADTRSEFPWFGGHAGERGSSDGAGWNLNLPIERGAGVETWERALDTALEHIADSSIDALVVALGVDTYVGDPLGTFHLDADDFRRAGRRIATLDRPSVIVQEGGYAADALGRNVAAFLSGIATRQTSG